MTDDLEQALMQRAWTDAAFRDLLRADPRAALTELGVEVPEEIEVDIRVQDRRTLYYLIPPLRSEPVEGVEQIDLWRSADLFCWIMPENLKASLLTMRRSFRENRSITS
ncbi:hypothetical protein [Amycolatopsis jejuensis]|uniref:hypothetical protein n=1 Tax=Amycolatopsis jejuensis TaxID=330084 RepID=UPI0005274441|nr:hypothetical protein [Amycolatopsis jejuensis]